jgi:DME family drug/metabolite transporter
LTSQKPFNNTLPIFAVLGASVLFASGGATRALIGFPGTGLSFASWRVAVGAIGLIAFMSWKHGTSGLIRLFKAPIMWPLGLTVLFYQASFFIGAARIGIAIGTLVALGSAPLLAGLLGWAMKLGKPTKHWAASTALAIFGLGLLTTTSGEVDLIGMLFVALAGLSYSVFTTLGVKVVRDFKVTGGEVLAVAFTIGALFATPIIATTSDWVGSSETILAILWAGFAATSFAYFLFGIGISHLNAGTVSTLTLFEPVTATTLGVLLLNEEIATRGWIGCGVIVLAVGLLGYFESRKSPAITA